MPESNPTNDVTATYAKGCLEGKRAEGRVTITKRSDRCGCNLTFEGMPVKTAVEVRDLLNAILPPES